MVYRKHQRFGQKVTGKEVRQVVEKKGGLVIKVWFRMIFLTTGQGQKMG